MTQCVKFKDPESDEQHYRDGRRVLASGTPFIRTFVSAKMVLLLGKKYFNPSHFFALGRIHKGFIGICSWMCTRFLCSILRIRPFNSNLKRSYLKQYMIGLTNMLQTNRLVLTMYKGTFQLSLFAIITTTRMPNGTWQSTKIMPTSRVVIKTFLLALFGAF